MRRKAASIGRYVPFRYQQATAPAQLPVHRHCSTVSATGRPRRRSHNGSADSRGSRPCDRTRPLLTHRQQPVAHEAPPTTRGVARHLDVGNTTPPAAWVADNFPLPKWAGVRLPSPRSQRSATVSARFASSRFLRRTTPPTLRSRRRRCGSAASRSDHGLSAADWDRPCGSRHESRPLDLDPWLVDLGHKVAVRPPGQAESAAPSGASGGGAGGPRA